MNQVNKFYLKYAVYQVEIDGMEGAILVNYGGNSFDTVGIAREKVMSIATQLLGKKHGVNFAYKFSAQGRSASGGDGRMVEENL